MAYDQQLADAEAGRDEAIAVAKERLGTIDALADRAVAAETEVERLRAALGEACDLAQAWIEKVEDCDSATERDLERLSWDKLRTLRERGGLTDPADPERRDDHGE